MGRVFSFYLPPGWCGAGSACRSGGTSKTAAGANTTAISHHGMPNVHAAANHNGVTSHKRAPTKMGARINTAEIVVISHVASVPNAPYCRMSMMQRAVPAGSVSSQYYRQSATMI